jgi:hypothetical protein
MGLDAFMGSGKKKKTSKQKIKKSATKIVAEKNKENKLNQKTHNENNLEEPKFRLLKVKLACSSKCGYKKILKRSKSFIPKERDLICPRCGKQMKIKK